MSESKGSLMSELSGDDIAKLSRALSGSLNFDDLGLFVHANGRSPFSSSM